MQIQVHEAQHVCANFPQEGMESCGNVGTVIRFSLYAFVGENFFFRSGTHIFCDFRRLFAKPFEWAADIWTPTILKEVCLQALLWQRELLPSCWRHIVMLRRKLPSSSDFWLHTASWLSLNIKNQSACRSLCYDVRLTHASPAFSHNRTIWSRESLGFPTFGTTSRELSEPRPGKPGNCLAHTKSVWSVKTVFGRVSEHFRSLRQESRSEASRSLCDWHVCTIVLCCRIQCVFLSLLYYKQRNVWPNFDEWSGWSWYYSMRSYLKFSLFARRIFLHMGRSSMGDSTSKKTLNSERSWWCACNFFAFPGSKRLFTDKHCILPRCSLGCHGHGHG